MTHSEPSETGPWPLVRGTAPPYYAAILTTVLSPDEHDLGGYAEAASDMLAAAATVDGYLGMEYARDGDSGITVSYWRDLQALRSWREHIAHMAIQRIGQERFYLAYRARICRVEREYEWVRGQPLGMTPDLPREH